MAVLFIASIMQGSEPKGTGWGWIARLFPRFFKIGWVNRWIILGLVLVVPLTFFMYFTQVRMEVLEMGTKAPHYVISQIDFSFLDQEATQALKQEATRDISTIYKLSEHEVLTYRQQVENELIEHQQWRKDLPGTTFDEIYAVLESIQEILLQERFTDARTQKKLEALGLAPLHLQLFSHSYSHARVVLDETVWQSLQKELLTLHALTPEPVAYLVSLFSVHQWILQPDFSLQESIQHAVRAEISNQYTHIEAGIQIIKKGEEVTQRHIQMLAAMKGALDAENDQWNLQELFSSALLAVSLVMVAALYLYFFHRRSFSSFSHGMLLVLILLLTLGLAKGVELLLLSIDIRLIQEIRFPLLIPLAALLLSALLGTEVATSASFFLLIIVGVSQTFDTDVFLLMNFLAFALTIFFGRRLHRRREVFSVCGKVFLALIPAVIAINLGSQENFEWSLSIDLLSNAFFLLMTAVIALVILPFLESGFGVMTDMSLMDYMDPDQELLKRLSLEAPGTYQHSLVVGHIAEAAAKAIGANGLFCRAATLYHDIGKLLNPHYFTENQLGGFNIHHLLTPLESTQVIIAHVTEGEALARKHGLPQCFIDIIREHHGTTMVYYFYCKQVEQMNGDVTRVNEKLFRYFGPKPRSKESAIIMLADTVEAASRSLGEITERALAETIDKLVARKTEDGQLDECQLTFEELGRVKKAMIKSLVVASHFRIKYPENP